MAVATAMGATGLATADIDVTEASTPSTRDGDGVITAYGDGAQGAIDRIDAALSTVSTTRADLGAKQNRL
ncbi:flagellin, partial [Pseudokineococcus sp. 1T1Z-3]